MYQVNYASSTVNPSIMACVIQTTGFGYNVHVTSGYRLGLTFDSFGVGWIIDQANSRLSMFTGTSCPVTNVGAYVQVGTTQYAFATSDYVNNLYFMQGTSLGVGSPNGASGFGGCAGFGGGCGRLGPINNNVAAVSAVGGIAYYNSNLYVLAGSSLVNLTLTGASTGISAVLPMPGSWVAADLANNFYVSSGAQTRIASNVNGYYNKVFLVQGAQYVGDVGVVSQRIHTRTTHTHAALRYSDATAARASDDTQRHTEIRTVRTSRWIIASSRALQSPAHSLRCCATALLESSCSQLTV